MAEVDQAPTGVAGRPEEQVTQELTAVPAAPEVVAAGPDRGAVAPEAAPAEPDVAQVAPEVATAGPVAPEAGQADLAEQARANVAAIPAAPVAPAASAEAPATVVAAPAPISPVAHMDGVEDRHAADLAARRTEFIGKGPLSLVRRAALAVGMKVPDAQRNDMFK